MNTKNHRPNDVTRGCELNLVLVVAHVLVGVAVLASGCGPTPLVHVRVMEPTGSAPEAKPATPAYLEVVDSERLSKKPLWLTDRVEFNVAVKNSTETYQTIWSVDTSCDCAVADDQTLPIELSPGETGILRMVANLERYIATTCRNGSYDFQAAVVVRGVSDEQVARCTLDCNLKSPAMIDRPTVHLGQVFRGKSFGTEVVNVRLVVPSKTELEYGGEILRIDVDEASTGHVALAVSVRDNALAGPFDETFWVSGKSWPCRIPVRVIGVVHGDIVPIPERADAVVLDLADRPVIETNIQALAGRLFHIVDVKWFGDAIIDVDRDVTIAPSSGVSEHFVVRAITHPPGLGRFAGTLVVVTQDSQRTWSEVGLPVTLSAVELNSTYHPRNTQRGENREHNQ